MLWRNQWVTLSLILLAALITRVVTAETSSALPSRKLSDSVSETLTQPSNPHELDVNIGPGLALWNRMWGWSLNAGAVSQLTPGLPIYFGADFGLDFWNIGLINSGASTKRVGIQMLPTAYYRFDLPKLPAWHPYAGLSVGPNWMIGSDYSRVFFELLIRPGISYSFSSDLSLAFEPKFGLLGNRFAFMPTLSGVFAL
jgi:hypothetical protein